MNAAILGLKKAEIDERFEAIEAFAEIGRYIDQPVKTYSSGMFVRLAFSVAIHVEPQLLIVDEALAVGDARFQIKCLNRIKKLRESGVTILYVSHDVGSIRMLCDRAVWLDSGRVRMAGSVFPVTSQYMEYLFDSSEQNEVPSDSLAAGASAGDGEFGAAELKARPVNHWGSHPGCVESAGLFDSDGNRRDSFHNQEPISVHIVFRVPKGVSRETLSVAFSIKDLKGSDLVVSSTAERSDIRFDGDAGRYEVRFNFDNCLNTGQYLLVIAVEERLGATIQYYEYIEGAHYFSSIQPPDRHGMFLPAIERHASPLIDCHETFHEH